MSRLRELQRVFRDGLTATDADAAGVRAASEHVNPSPRLAPREHIAIYRRAVLGTLTRALGDIYPVCRRLVGDQFFNQMARAYARQRPSRSPDLGDYGEPFGGFIAGYTPAAGLVYLPDVARLEWHWHRAFHAADAPPLDTAAVARVPATAQAAIVFRLPPSAALLRSPYPVDRIWQVNQPDWSGEQAVDLAAGAVCLLVWRRDYDQRMDPLTEAEWWLLQGLAAGKSLGELARDDADEQLASLLPRCVARGWIAGFSLI